MRLYKRKEFLNRVGIFVAASVTMPRFLFGNIKPAARQKVEDTLDYRVVDLHCHPSLKMYLWNQHLWKWHLPGPGANEVQMQDDLHQLRFGNLKGLVVSHYLIEASTIKEWNLLKSLFPFINRLLHGGLSDKIEHEDASNFTQINIMMDILETQVHLVNKRQDDLKFVIARTHREFVEASKVKGQIAIAHAIEGAHAIGRNFPISAKRKEEFKQKEEFSQKKSQKMVPPEQESDPAFYYIRNLEALYARGVCMITLAHIFQNDLAKPVEGVSSDEKRSLHAQWSYDPDRDNCDLSPVGVAVAKRMLELGIIIDLTHSTPAARRNVFQIAGWINDARTTVYDMAPNPDNTGEKVKKYKQKRPLTFTHVGMQSIFTKYDGDPTLQNYKFYDVDAFEIDQICECDGVIGVIPENFWLTGVDKKIKGKDILPGDYKNGIKYIIETMIAINKKTRKKDFSNIAIGTDFDGFADAPGDLYVPEQLTGLIEAIKNMSYTDDVTGELIKITPQQAESITSGNAYRLLERGWGDKMEPVAIGKVTSVGTCSDSSWPSIKN